MTEASNFREDAVAIAVSNLQGNVGSGSGAFSGGGTFNLQDSATQAFTYSFAPVSRGTATAGVAVNAANGSTDLRIVHLAGIEGL